MEKLHRAFPLRLLVLTSALFAVAFLATKSDAASPTSTPQIPSGYPGLTVTSSDETGLTIELVTPPAGIDARGAVSVAHLNATVSAAGAPALPYFSTFIAIPPKATVSIAVNELHTASRDVAYVQPAPTASLRSSGQSAEATFDLVSADTVFETVSSLQPDPAIYSSAAFYPEKQFALSEPMYAGDLRIAKLELFPLRYSPGLGELRQATHLTVHLRFDGAELNPDALTADPTDRDRIWREQILNYPPSSWRVETAETAAASAVSLPVGEDTFKIEVNRDGIYEISGSELQSAGMNIGNVAPASIQMMHRGKPVAYQFINVDGSAGFGPSDKVRFYGWEFDGTRYEQLYVGDNVFWLWAGGTGQQVGTAANEAGKGFTKVNDFNESITSRTETWFFEGWAINWDNSPNDPTSWHTAYLQARVGTPQAVNLNIDLPDPKVSSGSTAKVTVEFTTRLNTRKEPGATSTGKVSLNGATESSSSSWQNQANLNIEHTVPVSQLLQPGQGSYPTNNVRFELSGEGNAEFVRGFVTRTTVEYPRLLKAVSDELEFGVETAGSHEFGISGFSSGSPNDALVWDVSDKYQPVQITVRSQDISGSPGNYTYAVGRTHGANARILTATVNSVLAVKKITKYVPANLTPPNGTGDWVAISHKSLRPAADQLAQFRASQSGLTTWVVDVQDVANQYGFGFNTPDAIRAYLRSALTEWDRPPLYLVLFGDATLNPRNLKCTGCGASFDPNTPTLVVTDLLFIDRFNGLIPVDYTFGLLSGDDLIPELSVGRIPAETLAEALSTVEKIKTYETGFAAEKPWHRRVLFIADNPDAGGDFCQESMATAGHLPASLNKTYLCLPNEVAGGPTLEESTQVLRVEMFRQINDVGVAIMNYRGHGGPFAWANPNIMNMTDGSQWQNVGRPLVLISADCLDGHFAQTYREGLGETFVGLDNLRGSAAHWASTGLGYSFEHTVLHDAFYDGVFRLGLQGIGDTANYAKIEYMKKGYHPSEVYAFTLLGDPAMSAYPWQLKVNLPLILRR